MSLVTVFLAVFVFTLLTVAYIKGRSVVEKNAPESLVKFHFIMVAVRFLFAVTAVGILCFQTTGKIPSILRL